MNKVIAYSLLAHIHNTGTLLPGLLEVFIPLAKRALSIMNREGVRKGKSIAEVKVYVDRLYGIDIPIPVLRSILHKVALELNKNGTKFQLFADNAFSINDYLFDDFEETIEKYKTDIEELQRLFGEFCSINSIDKENYATVFSFIEKNKVSLSKYLTKSDSSAQQDFSAEAEFVKFFKPITKVYDLIRKIYLGSIISSYLEFKTENLKTDIELLFDTNFVISLIDLNTPESTHTCLKLIEIAKAQGFRLSVLKDTIEECQRLLMKRAEHFDSAFLQRKINPEDIYNACDRRQLGRTDLERISDNLQITLNDFGITVVFDTSKFQNIAKFSSEYESLKKVRNNLAAALHDATAIHYVRDKRKIRIKDFENVNCWFVNNNIGDQSIVSTDYFHEFQPESIKVDDLVNILWLSNPNINKNVSDSDLADIGITALVSVTLGETLPKAAIIRELDDNIQKYAKEKLTDKDVVRVASRIMKRQLRDIEKLNELANTDSEAFTQKLLKESEQQMEQDEIRLRKLEELFGKLDEEQKSLKKAKSSYEEQQQKLVEKENRFLEQLHSKDHTIEKLKKQIEANEIKVVNEKRKIERDNFIRSKVANWRLKGWIELLSSVCIMFLISIYVLGKFEWNFGKVHLLLIDIKTPMVIVIIGALINSLFFGVVVKSLVDKYRNHSNIKAFKESIVIPEDLKEIMPKN